MVEDDISADSQDEKMTRHHSSSPPSQRHTTPIKAAQTPSPTNLADPLGHDHPEEKTRETAPSPPTTRNITEPLSRSDTRSKGSSRTPKDLEDPAYRPQKIIGKFSDNR